MKQITIELRDVIETLKHEEITFELYKNNNIWCYSHILKSKLSLNVLEQKRDSEKFWVNLAFDRKGNPENSSQRMVKNPLYEPKLMELIDNFIERKYMVSWSLEEIGEETYFLVLPEKIVKVFFQLPQSLVFQTKNGYYSFFLPFYQKMFILAKLPLSSTQFLKSISTNDEESKVLRMISNYVTHKDKIDFGESNLTISTREEIEKYLREWFDAIIDFYLNGSR